MAHFKQKVAPTNIERVAGNGLLHRRALLGRGMAFAGALGAGAGLKAADAVAGPLAEPDWGQAAYILAQNKLIDAKQVINAQTLPKVQMPNRTGFIPQFPERMPAP